MPVGRPKGIPRSPNSGRKKGTPNKKTAMRAQLVDRAIAEGETPLEFMLKLMRREIPKADPAIRLGYLSMRFEAAKAAAPYVHPKPSAAPPQKDAPEEYARKVREAVTQIDESVPSKPE